jgi:hypothetical protein
MPARKKRTNLKVVAGTEDAETEVREKPVRRTFTTSYKASILRELDGAPAGARAAILRREGLYSSHIQKWRAEEWRRRYEERKRGRQKSAFTAENRKLRAANERLEKQLYQANKIIELQKKVAEILGVTLEKSDADE